MAFPIKSLLIASGTCWVVRDRATAKIWLEGLYTKRCFGVKCVCQNHCCIACIHTIPIPVYIPTHVDRSLFRVTMCQGPQGADPTQGKILKPVGGYIGTPSPSCLSTKHVKDDRRSHHVKHHLLVRLNVS